MLPVTEAQNHTLVETTTTVTTNPGGLLGIFVSDASSTPTITVTDGATTMVQTFTPANATFYALPARFKTSLIVDISGTVQCTVFWSP